MHKLIDDELFGSFPIYFPFVCFVFPHAVLIVWSAVIIVRS